MTSKLKIMKTVKETKHKQEEKLPMIICGVINND